MTSSALFETDHLTKLLPALPGARAVRKEAVPIIEDVCLQINAGEVLGIVGEAGSGKTTLARLAINLMQPTSGRVLFDGRDLTSLNREEMLAFRRQAQIVFSDPTTAFDPHYTIGQSLAEPLITHTSLAGDDLRLHIEQMLRQVGIQAAVQDLYPHQFRPGQLQRMAIARSLALRPQFVVADDPLSALEPLAQVQILRLIQQLQSRMEFACLFLTPRLAMAFQISERIAILLQGRVVEVVEKKHTEGSGSLHPYTQMLLTMPTKPSKGSAITQPDSHYVTTGAATRGCPFYRRCAQAFPRCVDEAPLLTPLEAGHSIACHLF